MTVIVKLNNKEAWSSVFSFQSAEDRLINHWRTLESNIAVQLRSFNYEFLSFDEDEELDDTFFAFQGIGEGVIVNAVQINHNKIPNTDNKCQCPTSGVHNINRNHGDLKDFVDKNVSCWGDLYGCQEAESEYQFCFSGNNFKRYKAIQVGSNQNNIIPSKISKMPKPKSCKPVSIVEGGFNVLKHG